MGVAPDDAVPQAAVEKDVKQDAGRVEQQPRKITPWSVVVWVLLAVAGFAVNEVLANIRDAAMNKPDYLAQLAKQQDKDFADIKSSLQHIGNSIASGDRKALADVRNAVDDIERTNRGLVHQLALAKRENDTLRTAAESKGVSGGYDFILAEGGGFRIDPATVIGLQSVDPRGVRIGLSSSSSDAGKQFLRAGDSLAFKNDAGRDCKVSLLSYENASVGTASFAIHCG